jgi:chromate transporter
MASAEPTSRMPSFRDLTMESLKVGLLGFGGPAGQIALMHRLFVDERRWLTDQAFTRALGFCAVLPGPEAQQLATWVGWRLHGVRGGLVAGSLFVLPGAAIMLVLAWVYAAFGALPLIGAAFTGAACAVIPMMVQGLVKIARRTLKSPLAWGLAVCALALLLTRLVPFPVAIGGGAVLGALFLTTRGRSGPMVEDLPGAGGQGDRVRWGVVAACAGAWLAPPVLAALMLGPDHVLAHVGQVMSTLALFSFGGAYSLLSWLNHVAVETEGWLTATQMLAGMGLSETTPGPAVLVTQFVGFLAGWNTGGPVMAVAAAAMASWCIFMPSFLWVFAGAPLAQRLTGSALVRGALDGINAAVVGIIAALVIGFLTALLFTGQVDLSFGPARITLPLLEQVRAWPLAITAACGLALWRGAGHITVVLAAAAAGMLLLA